MVISAISHISWSDYIVSSDCCITIEMVSARSVVVGVFKLPKRCPSQGFRIIRADSVVGLCIMPTQRSNLRIIRIAPISTTQAHVLLQLTPRICLGRLRAIGEASASFRW